jgi:LPXTG-motif cell wall-anchored protein
MITQINNSADMLGAEFDVNNLIDMIALTASNVTSSIANAQNKPGATPASASAETAGILASFQKQISDIAAGTKSNQVPILTIAGIGAVGLVAWLILKKKK